MIIIPYTHTHTDKSVFGVPLLINVRREGRALPSSILAGFDHLRKNGGLETRGLFRRGASKAKIEGLKLITESNPDNSDYDDFSCYEVADLIKLYFRELPEPLITSRLSETLIMIQESKFFNTLQLDHTHYDIRGNRRRRAWSQDHTHSLCLSVLNTLYPIFNLNHHI